MFGSKQCCFGEDSGVNCNISSLVRKLFEIQVYLIYLFESKLRLTQVINEGDIKNVVLLGEE